MHLTQELLTNVQGSGSSRSYTKEIQALKMNVMASYQKLTMTSWEQSLKPILLQLHAAAAAKSHQLCPTLCDPIDGGPRGSHPWDSPGKNTGVGCHFLLQCMKVKSENEVAQSCPTLSDPMDCSLPDSSVHGIFQARVLEWGAIVFSVDSIPDLGRSHMPQNN